MSPIKYFKLLNWVFLLKTILMQDTLAAARCGQHHRTEEVPAHQNGNFRSGQSRHAKDTNSTFDLFQWSKGSSFRNQKSNIDKRFHNDWKENFKNGSTIYGRHKSSLIGGTTQSAPKAEKSEMTQSLKYPPTYEKHNVHDNTRASQDESEMHKRKFGFAFARAGAAVKLRLYLFGAPTFSVTYDKASEPVQDSKNGYASDPKPLPLDISQSRPTRQTKHFIPSDLESNSLVYTQTTSTSSTTHSEKKGASTKMTIIGSSVGAIGLAATALVSMAYYKFSSKKEDSKKIPQQEFSLNEFMDMPPSFEFKLGSGCHNAGRAHSAHARMFNKGITQSPPIIASTFTLELSEMVQESEEGFFREGYSEEYSQTFDPIVATMTNNARGHAYSYPYRSPDSCEEKRSFRRRRRATFAASNVKQFIQRAKSGFDGRMSDPDDDSEDNSEDPHQPSLLELRLSTNYFGSSRS